MGSIPERCLGGGRGVKCSVLGVVCVEEDDYRDISGISEGGTIHDAMDA